jgi:hypothetical protein
MSGSDPVRLQDLGSFEESIPFDEFITYHAGVGCSSSKISLLEIRYDVSPKAAAQVERKDRETVLASVADYQRRFFEVQIVVRMVQYLDMQAGNPVSLLYEHAGGNSGIDSSGKTDYDVFLIFHSFN